MNFGFPIRKFHSLHIGLGKRKTYMILFIKISLIIISSIFKIDIYSKSYLLRTNVYYKNEIKRIEDYFNYCNNLKEKQNFKKVNNPKISIISAIYNREKFISRFIGSVQSQSFKDIEIILVDDNSFDNSIKLIEKMKKEDKRIVLIKNKKNRGTFMARNLGVLKSKAKYIIIPDPDDIISKDIIRICYKYGEKYHYDIIRFNMYLGNRKILDKNFVKKSKPIYQPELSTYIFYENDELEQIDYFVANKFIKKKVYIESLNSLNKFYFYMYMTSMEDNLMNYLLHRTAKSFFFLKKIGYMYKRTSESTSKKKYIPKIKLKYKFIYLKFIFEFSKNTKYEKDMVNLYLNKTNKKFNFKEHLLKTEFCNDFDFYYEVINNVINNIYISDDNFNLLKNLKNIILKKNKTYFKFKKNKNILI
jgi:glycosyltransferase involved in cell wall biosynthesis